MSKNIDLVCASIFNKEMGDCANISDEVFMMKFTEALNANNYETTSVYNGYGVDVKTTDIDTVKSILSDTLQEFCITPSYMDLIFRINTVEDSVVVVQKRI